MRIEQVLLAGPALLLCFRVSQLLTFYHGTVSQLLGPGSQARALHALGPAPACVAGHVPDTLRGGEPPTDVPRGVAAQLAGTLAAADQLARRMFAEQLKARGDKLLRYPPAPPPDLSPPPQARAALGCAGWRARLCTQRLWG